MKTSRTVSREEGCMIIVIIMLAALTSHLVMALQTSRENERELSKRLYNAVRNQRLKP